MIKYISTRNTFTRENFNMKKTEIAFYSFKKILSVDIYMDICRCASKGNGNSLEVFRLFSMFLKDKTFK